jgi:DNA-directed RNA polymerase subunit K/omega
MKKLINSRGTQINTELCVEKAGNRFDLIIIASQRLRELRRKPSTSGQLASAVDALLDIQNNLIKPREYLKRVK